jgi:hypothetical protein
MRPSAPVTRAATAAIPLDVQVIAATNRHLEAEVAERRFREDLFYRLNTVHLVVPPLRNRQTDIPRLIEHFSAHYAAFYGRAPWRPDGPTLARLLACPWPGNVRQLAQTIQRIYVFGAEVFGAEVFGAEVFGAEVFGAEVFGAEVFGADDGAVLDELFAAAAAPLPGTTLPVRRPRPHTTGMPPGSMPRRHPCPPTPSISWRSATTPSAGRSPRREATAARRRNCSASRPTR